MKSFGKYISKYLLSFVGFILVLVMFNILAFIWTFHNAISKDYGFISPQNMLEETVAASSSDGISEEMADKLYENQIWVMFLNQEGKCLWSIDLPAEVTKKYTIQDVAVFSKGYLEDYPVFVWNHDDGLLVLGYPKSSYTKITSNYYPVYMIQTIPIFFMVILILDLLLLFLAYFYSKRKIIRNTEPIISSIQTLSDGNPISLSATGELSEIADSVKKASQILSRQNEARANWISGVSHDIRTPLSMIMGYAGRISSDKATSDTIREQADIIRQQSIKIKDLVQDLNLVSQLEYEMQPLHRETVRLSKLLRSYVVELLNGGLPDTYPIEIEIAPIAETVTTECDARLITRAINNLVQNSIRHNPKGCEIKLSLNEFQNMLELTVQDNGVGLSTEKLQKLEKKLHYMKSTDERLDLRHGLGLLLVRQIVEAHNGTMKIESKEQTGYKTILAFSKC